MPSPRFIRSLVAFAIVLPGAAHAQAPFSQLSAGVHYGYNAGYDLNVAGGQIGISLGHRFTFVPSFDIYWNVDGKQWGLNGDATYLLFNDRGTRFSVGTGVNLAMTSGDGPSTSTAGWNILANIEPALRGPIRPFGEVRFTAGDSRNYQIVAGLNVMLRR